MANYIMKKGSKTINISPELHQKIRIHCAKNDLKINEFIEKELEQTILNYVYEFDTPEMRKKMEDDVEKGISIEIEIKSPEEEMMEAQMEAQQEAPPMDKAAMCENCTDPTCKGCEGDMMALESDKGYDEKPMRKSWKAEAQAFEEVNKLLLEEIETYKAKVSELEVAAIAKVAPTEESIEVEGQMIAKSAIPAPILKKLEEMQKAVETEALRKRAEEVLPNFKGTADERGKLLKSVGEDEGLLTLLKAADAAFAALPEGTVENLLKPENKDKVLYQFAPYYLKTFIDYRLIKHCI